MAWLDTFFSKSYTQIQVNGTTVRGEIILNLSGMGIVATDDAVNNRTTLTNPSLAFGTGYAATTTSTNFAVGSSAPVFNGGQNIVFLANQTALPSANPSGGAYLYADGGTIKGRGGSGTITTIATADPHCKRCGRDFSLEWEHPYRKEHFAVCVPCLVGALEASGHKIDEFVIHNQLAT